MMSNMVSYIFFYILIYIFHMVWKCDWIKCDKFKSYCGTNPRVGWITSNLIENIGGTSYTTLIYQYIYVSVFINMYLCTCINQSVSFSLSNSLLLSLSLSVYTHTHTHTYIYTCVCVCVYIYIYNLDSSSSFRAIIMDIPDPFSPFLYIVHRSRQVLRVTPHILTELLYVGPSNGW